MKWSTLGRKSNNFSGASTRQSKTRIKAASLAAISEALEGRLMLSATQASNSADVAAGLLLSQISSGMNSGPVSPTTSSAVPRVGTALTPMVESPTRAASKIVNAFGLQAAYYNNGDLSGTPVTRIDATANFNWGRTAPVKKVGGGTFAVNWAGEVVAPRTGTFTFYIRSIGGADLTLDGATVVDNTGSSATQIVTATGTMSLVAGQSYPLNLQYAGTGKHAMISLQWSGPKTARQVIPRRDLLSGLSAPSTPTGLSAQVASSSEIDLSWQPGGDATAYTVQRASDGVHFSTVATIGNVAGYQDLISLRANSTYTYRVIASNAVGSSSASSPISAKTLANGVTAINASAAPSGLNAIAITWAIPAATLTGFEIDRSTDGSATWTPLGTVDATTNTFSDTNATDGHSYSYRITAMDNSATAPFVGTTSVIVPLDAPSGLSVAQTSGTTATLQWTNNSTAATGVEIDRSTNGGVSWAVLTTAAASATSYNTTISPGQNYAYRVRALEGTSVSSTYSNTAAISPGLTAPSNLTATVNSPNSITLQWTDAGTGQTGYEIDRSADGGNTWPSSFYASASATSCTDTSALGAASYLYRIRAVAGSTDSAYAPAASATTALAAPGNVSALALTSSAITVQWTDTNAGETGYEVDRSPNGSSGWTTLTTTAPNTTSYTDSGLSLSTTYYYRVIADGPNATTVMSPIVNAQTAGSDAPQYLLTPAALQSVQAEAQANTTQWQAFIARLNSQLDQVTTPSYEGDSLQWASDYALGYQALQTINPTLAGEYADKAIAVLLSGLQDDLRVYDATQMFLVRGDGTTTTFTLPNTDINASTLEIWDAPIQVVPVIKGATNGQDTVGYYTTFLKVSNTSDGPADYTEGVDWQYNANYTDGDIDWSLGGNQPATGATYYVTTAASLGAPQISDYTLNGNTITFTTPPGPNDAIFVQYQYTDTTTGLPYQQTSDGRGGFNNIMLDSGYATRYLKDMAIALDWLWSYSGMTTGIRSETVNMLVQWFNSLNGGGGGYDASTPASNYGAGEYGLDMAIAIALQNRDTADAPGMMQTMQAYHQNNIIPILTPPTTQEGPQGQAPEGTEWGGFWAEGWNYGAQAIENVLSSGVAFADAGWGSDAVEQAWSNQLIETLIEQQPTQSTILDFGDGYADPLPFPSMTLVVDAAYSASDPTMQSYANYILQNYPSNSDWTVPGFQQMLFENPSAPAAFWGGTNNLGGQGPNGDQGGLPLQYLSSGTGVAVARRDWNYDSTWLAFMDGNLLNADHQQMTQGDLEINRGTDQLLVNAAAVAGLQYPPDKSRYGNIVAIDDGGAGEQTYRWSQGYWYGNQGCIITHFDGTSNYMYAQGNYAEAYRADPGWSASLDPASELVRDVFYVRNATTGSDYVVVYDRATTTQASYSKQLQWFFNGTTTGSGNSFSSTVGSSTLFGQVYSDVPLATVEQTVNVNGTNLQEVTTNPTSPTASVRYVTALQVSPSSTGSEDASTHVQSTDGQLEGVQIGSYVVLFGRNGAVSGGSSYSITAGAGQTITHDLTDMTPGHTYTLSGANQGTVTANAQGVVTFTTTGTGSAQTVTLS
jgi:fibronectin type 3 domain-containing protein